MTKFKQNNLKKLVHWPHVSQIISEWLIYSFQQHPNFYNNDPLSVMPDHADVSDGYRLSTYVLSRWSDASERLCPLWLMRPDGNGTSVWSRP